MSDRRQVLTFFENEKELMDRRVADGIERYRKGDATLTVLDSAGKPICGARVKLTHKKHEFKFGANLFMLDELESKEKNDLYKERFAALFNMATLPFYWDATEPEEGKTRYAKDSTPFYRRPPIDLCIEFCEKHGIEPREHALAYDQFFPKWLYNASVEEIKTALERRYREIAERYADKIPTIEVTNEMMWAHGKGKTAFYEEPDYVEWCFKLAEKYFPNNQLGINEAQNNVWVHNGRTSDPYYAYTEAAMLKGARIDAIGMQFHMFRTREREIERAPMMYSPSNLYRHLDLYARFGKPIQITEITIPAYSEAAEDEAYQAEILKKLYTIWFSHPAVEQIIYWNLVDGYAHFWDPDPAKIRASQGDMTLGENIYYGGLLRFDMTPKPAYYAIKDLLQKEWHTEVEAVTDQNGALSFRGFYGDYEIEIEHNGRIEHRTVTLSAKGDGRICTKI
ncbi:MAG: endo-1,4-beta-xylanase [Clostridia bacterium]|nr:endo-1,4-beta-xylanase [Clostridia bacterium]